MWLHHTPFDKQYVFTFCKSDQHIWYKRRKLVKRKAVLSTKVENKTDKECNKCGTELKRNWCERFFFLNPAVYINLCVKNDSQIKESQDFVESQGRSHIAKDLEKRIKNKPVEMHPVLGSTTQTII